MEKIICCDTREQRNEEVIAYFKMIKQPYEIVKVDSGDYIYKNDYTTIIDLKKDLVEVAGNIAGTRKQHDRFKREIQRAKDLGCKRFVVLIREPLQNLEAVQTWETPRLRNGRPLVKRPPTALYKTMKTFESKYGVEWQFTTRTNAGRDIIAILNGTK